MTTIRAIAGHANVNDEEHDDSNDLTDEDDFNDETDPDSDDDGNDSDDDGNDRNDDDNNDDVALANTAATRRQARELKKLKRGRGAKLAQSRTDEDFTLTSGTRQTCMPDAVANCIKMVDSKAKISVSRMCTLAVPQLGNTPQATWESMKTALAYLSLPFILKEATSRFQNQHGIAPMVSLLRAASGVFVVALVVEIKGIKCDHCIAFSATDGKLIDNGAKTLPVYIQDLDCQGRNTAQRAFRKLLEQKTDLPFSFDITDIYELCEQAQISEPRPWKKPKKRKKGAKDKGTAHKQKKVGRATAHKTR
jgi:hypothetical protein